MCLIIYKERNTKFNQKSITKWVNNSFNRNKDSLGYMIKKPGYVLVDKNYKNPEEMLKSLELLHETDNLDKYEMAIHLRNASPGTSVCINTAHPICSDEELNKKKKFKTKDTCIVHNGSFRDFSSNRSYINGIWTYGSLENESDTTLFVKEYFAGKKKGLEFFSYLKSNHPTKMDTFFGYNDNKIIVFKSGMKTFHTGSFIKEEDYFFSNDSFKADFTARSTNHNPSFSRIHERDVTSRTPVDEFPIPPATHSVEFDEITVRYKIKKALNESRLFLHSAVPFACSMKSSCSFSIDKDSKHLCCQNLKDNDEQKQFRNELAKAISGEKYTEIANKNEAVYSILKFMYKNSDKISFFWHPCKACKGVGYTKHAAFDCEECKALGFKLSILLKYNNEGNKIFSEVTVFTVNNTNTNGEGRITNDSKIINANVVISSLIKYAKKQANSESSESLVTLY